ncbi:MAG TPA: hypothetical protein VFC94_03500 [Bacteroidaceae bacterium]|nr:hypothetical protein [Bacteroidaceae bacterium]
MANRRLLKKNINSIIIDLITECLFYQDMVPNADVKAADDIIRELLSINNDFLSRVSHTEKGNAKAYYRALTSSFNKEIVKITDKIAELNK